MVNEQLIVATIKGFILGKLDDWTANDLEGLLGEPLPVQALLETVVDQIYPFRQLVEEHSEAIVEALNMSTVRKFVRDNRPDLLEILRNRAAANKLEKVLKIVKFIIENISLEPWEIVDEFYKRIRAAKERTVRTKPALPVPQVRDVPEYIENDDLDAIQQNPSQAIEVKEPTLPQFPIPEQKPVENDTKSARDINRSGKSDAFKMFYQVD